MNGQKAGGIWYYITFNAKHADAAEDSDDAVKTFQALGWWGSNADLDVSFYRLKKSSSHEVTLFNMPSSLLLALLVCATCLC